MTTMASMLFRAIEVLVHKVNKVTEVAADVVEKAEDEAISEVKVVVAALVAEEVVAVVPKTIPRSSTSNPTV